jgi:hypothetical protein
MEVPNKFYDFEDIEYEDILDIVKFHETEKYPGYCTSECGIIAKITKNSYVPLKPHRRKDGYHEVKITIKDNGVNKRVNRLVHEMVCEMYNVNPDPLKFTTVNHIDGNKGNNDMMNLEWCTPSMNIQHAHDTGLIKVKLKPCSQFNLDGTLVASYKSVKEAEEKTGFKNAGIARACKGNAKTYMKFKWKYDNEEDIKRVDGIDHSKWAIIEEFPDYKISRDGKVYSIKSDTMMKGQKNSLGMRVKLFINSESKTRYIHRLVATAYIPNPNMYPNVVHLNGDIEDNRVINLQWYSPSQSMSVALSNNKIPPPRTKRVIQYDIDGNYVETFNSIKEASAKTGASADTIPLVCEGKRNLSGGFIWAWDKEK